MKKILLFILLTTISSFCFGQKSVKYPIFPGCNKYKTNHYQTDKHTNE